MSIAAVDPAALVSGWDVVDQMMDWEETIQTAIRRLGFKKVKLPSYGILVERGFVSPPKDAIWSEPL